MNDAPPPSDSPFRAPFVRRALLVAAIALVILVLVWTVRAAVDVLLMAFAAVLVAILLSSLAQPIHRYTRIPRGGALGIVLLLLIGLAGGLGVLVVPSFSREVDELAKTLPEQTKRIEAQILHYRWGRMLLNQTSGHQGNDDGPAPGDARGHDGSEHDASANTPAAPGTRAGPTTQPATSPTTAPTTQEGERLTKTVQAAAEPLMNDAGLMAAGVINALVATFIVLAAGIFLAVDPALYVTGVLRLLPPSRRALGAKTLAAIHYSLRWWLIGQGITMLVIGTLTGLGLWLIGVRLWLTFAILAGVFNFVPNFGPLVSFVPAILFALADPDGGNKVIWISLLYVVAQTFEGYVLTPLVQKRAVETPPALLILFQVLAGVMLGSIGLMLAAPLLAMIVVATKVLYVRETLGDRSVRVAADDAEGASAPES